jgi:hypothetical protein
MGKHDGGTCTATWGACDVRSNWITRTWLPHVCGAGKAGHAGPHVCTACPETQ